MKNKYQKYLDEFDVVLPSHTKECLCILCDWRSNIKDFLVKALEEREKEVIQEIISKYDQQIKEAQEDDSRALGKFLQRTKMNQNYIDRLVELAEEMHNLEFKTEAHFLAKLNFLLGYILALKKEGEEK